MPDAFRLTEEYMNKITTRLKRYGCLLLCLCLLMPLLQDTAAAVQDSSVVRVAWYPDSAYNITCENGERSGYGYEYQQSVAGPMITSKQTGRIH